MNAIWSPSQSPSSPDLPGLETRLEAFTPQALDAWLRIEMQAYSHPWSRGNFLDSHAGGHHMPSLWAGDALLAYCVAMRGVDEVHLLNLTVAPDYQGQGWARTLLDALCIWSRGQGQHWLWLEVRRSNTRALQLYERYGFHRVGLRTNYYPSRVGREDAVVMNLAL